LEWQQDRSGDRKQERRVDFGQVKNVLDPFDSGTLTI
jgi:hypothetical protein